MVEQSSAVGEQPVQVPVVDGQALRTDVFGHADRADHVERTVIDLAVVLDPDLDEIVEPGLGHTSSGVLRLFVADRHPDDACSVVLRGVHRHRPPTTSDVEQPRRRAIGAGSGRRSWRPSLRQIRSCLAAWRVDEGGIGRDEAGARIRHRRAEHDLVEVVADVVVMADHLLVTPERVAATPGDHLHGRGRRWCGSDASQAVGRGDELRQGGRLDPFECGSPFCSARRISDIGPTASMSPITNARARPSSSGDQMMRRQRVDRIDPQASRSVPRPDRRSVPELDLHGWCAEQTLDRGTDGIPAMDDSRTAVPACKVLTRPPSDSTNGTVRSHNVARDDESATTPWTAVGATLRCRSARRVSDPGDRFATLLERPPHERFGRAEQPIR